MPEQLPSQPDKRDGWIQRFSYRFARPFRDLARMVSRSRSSLSFSVMAGLLLLALPPVLLVTAASYLHARDLVTNQTTQQLQHLVSNKADQLAQSRSLNQKYINDLSNQRGIHTAISRYFQDSKSEKLDSLSLLFVDHLKKAQQPTDTSIIGLGMLNPEIKMIASSNPDWMGSDLSGEVVFQKLASGKISYAISCTSALIANQCVNISGLPLTDEKGIVRATLISFSQPLFPDFLLNTAGQLFSGASAFYLTGEDQWVGMDFSTGALIPIAAQAGELELLKPIFASSAREGTVGMADPGGEPVLAYARWLPEPNLGLVIKVPQSTVYQYVNPLVPFTILLLVFALFLILVLVYFSSRAFIRPIIQLTGSARNFAKGDWTERSTIRRSDEIGVLAATFNQMVEQLSELYRSLEFKVEERAQQLKTASDVGQMATSAGNRDEIAEQAVKLVVERFRYTFACILLADPASNTVSLQAAFSQNGDLLDHRNYRVSLNSNSLVGWVARNQQARVIADLSVNEFSANPLLSASSKSEAALPIVIGNQLLGVFEVQSLSINGFDADSLSILQTLSHQIATGLQNIRLLETTQLNLEESNLLFSTSRAISLTDNVDEMFEKVREAFAQTPYVSGIYSVEDGYLSIISITDPQNKSEVTTLQGTTLPFNRMITSLMQNPVVIVEDLANRTDFDYLLAFFSRRGCHSAAIFALGDAQAISAIIVLGSRSAAPISQVALQPILSLIQVIQATLQRFQILSNLQDRIYILQTLNRISQAISTETNLMVLYQTLHAQIRETFGSDISFLIALFNADQQMIEIPYVYEGDHLISIPPFPLGEGLTSYVINTRQPLMIVKDTEKRIVELGAKIVGQPAKSWIGVPLLLGDQPIGAMIVQDVQREERFTPSDFNLLAALAPQVAVTVRNVELLDRVKKQAEEFKIVTEISRDISATLETSQLLRNAVNRIRDQFGFYHASIFLLEPSGEDAVLKEATGEVGEEMKARGHRLTKGSPSIVGQVIARKQAWIVNDVKQEELYYPNPLLPETHSELAIPLMTGDTLLGVLDVQSRQTYAFSENEVKILSIMADHLAIAFSNSILFGENQNTLAEHRLLHQITISASDAKSRDEALEATARILLEAPSIQSVRIFWLEKGELAVHTVAGLDDANFESLAIHSEEGTVNQSFRERRPILVNRPLHSNGLQPGSFHFQSELAVPVFYGEQVSGVLVVANSKLGAFTQADQEFLSSVGNTLGVIIANNLLLGEIRQQMERQRQLFEITGRIRRSVDVQSIMETSAQEIARSLGVKRAHIELNVDRLSSRQSGSSSKPAAIDHKNGKNNGKENA